MNEKDLLQFRVLLEKLLNCKVTFENLDGKSKNSLKECQGCLDHREIEEFMKKHGYNQEEFAELLGVTVQAVRLWITGQRTFSPTNSRLLRMFERYPELMGEFY